MSNNLDTLFTSWTKATANLKYGVQRVFHDTLSLAAEGKTTLIYGADYRNGSPCLVNTVGSMLTVGGGSGIPTANFREVVSLFDQINVELFSRMVNTTLGTVSENAADVLVYHFAPLKEVPETPAVVGEVDGTYYEPTDEEVAESITLLFQACESSPVEIALDDEDLRSLSIEAVREHN